MLPADTYSPTNGEGDAMGSGLAREAANTQGIVVVYSCNAAGEPHGHARITYNEVARKLAAIRNFQFAGEFDASYHYTDPLYFVPNDTLVDLDFAHRLGIWGEGDLFGGVVPFPFVSTKVITHPLLAPDSPAPAGWVPGFAWRVRHAVLPGFSVFTFNDARNAGAHLLKQGPVRVKKATGTGGLGQKIVADSAALETLLQSLAPEEHSHYGLVLEINLEQTATHSVGNVRVGGLQASYHGRQRLTVNNQGEEVYGGSDLLVVRGDLDALLRLELEPQVRLAIEQARVYHDAALTSFPSMFASRCNYDVLQGIDQGGHWHSGVLEQSWRIGGASGAEMAALNAFQADPTLGVVRASTAEIYGESPALPSDAILYFSGIDLHAGPITKYARLHVHANP